MLAKLTPRARSEFGFTLIELLIVLVIIGILVAIALPAYLGFRDRADQRAAQANLRAAIPSVELYGTENDSYAGMTLAALAAVDRGVKLSAEPVVTSSSGTLDDRYCIESTHHGLAGGRALHHMKGGNWPPADPALGTPTAGACS